MKELPEDIRLLSDEYREISDRQDILIKKLRDKVDPLIDKVYFEDGENVAMDMVRQIPCSVVRAFAYDRIRNVLPKMKG